MVWKSKEGFYTSLDQRLRHQVTHIHDMMVSYEWGGHLRKTSTMGEMSLFCKFVFCGPLQCIFIEEQI